MKFLDLYGKEIRLPKASKYLIDWGAEAYCRSKFQRDVKLFLHKYWKYDTVFEELKIVGTKMSIDIYNATQKIAIEVQGAQHIKFNKHFQKTRTAFRQQLKRDEKKLDFCKINGITLVEIYDIKDCTEEFFLEYGIQL